MTALGKLQFEPFYWMPSIQRVFSRLITPVVIELCLHAAITDTLKAFQWEPSYATGGAGPTPWPGSMLGLSSHSGSSQSLDYGKYYILPFWGFSPDFFLVLLLFTSTLSCDDDPGKGHHPAHHLLGLEPAGARKRGHPRV